jgi:multicomponent Na+:H+ antiporter subunit B
VNERGRSILLLASFAVLAPAVYRIAWALPAFGEPTSAYGQTVNLLLPKLRNVSNMVAAVNFDVRGIDTIGEELMLLAATTGTTVLLRGRRGEDVSHNAGRIPGRGLIERSDATVLMCRIFAPLLMLFGLYVILHGTVTPGGGFQGGVIVASSLLMIYLGEGYRVWRRLVVGPALSVLEGSGASIFVATALLPLALGHPAAANLLPLGRWKDLFSGGSMVVSNASVGAAVIGSFGLIFLELLEETRAPASDDMPDEQHR